MREGFEPERGSTNCTQLATSVFLRLICLEQISMNEVNLCGEAHGCVEQPRRIKMAQGHFDLSLPSLFHLVKSSS